MSYIVNVTTITKERTGMFYDEYAGRFASPAEPDAEARFRAEYYENRAKDADAQQPSEPAHISLSRSDLSARDRALTSLSRYIRMS